jgi:hypothetical protein
MYSSKFEKIFESWTALISGLNKKLDPDEEWSQSGSSTGSEKLYTVL